MKGQWIGRYQGTNNGLILVDIDDCGDHFEGRAHLYDDDPELTGQIVIIETKDRQTRHNLELQIMHTNLQTGEILTFDQFNEISKDVNLPGTATVKIDLKPRALHISWVTSVGTSSKASLERSKSESKSEYRAERQFRSWEKFKKFAFSLESSRYIFRGQAQPWRLRTAFHRSQRKDLVRFITDDIPSLHHALTARTKHLFRLDDPLECGAFYNLIQHHGYPTPLLDWSHSPFIAAYFAFMPKRRFQTDSNSVRIFMFDSKAWRRDFRQLQKVTFARPHFSLLQALVIENERAMPQQGLSSVTNLDDIESYIRFHEAQNQVQYLRVFDLPFSSRESVLRELNIMGISAGSLFPGLDGACEEMKGKFFGY